MLRKIAEYLYRGLSPVSLLLARVSMFILAGLMFLVVFDVLLRRLLNTPILGAHDITSVGFALVIFLPMGFCTLEGRHVELSGFTERLPQRVQHAINSCMMLLTTAILAVTCWQLIRQGLRLQAMNGVTSILRIPVAPFVYAATFGMAIMALLFFSKFLLALSSLTEKTS